MRTVLFVPNVERHWWTNSLGPKLIESIADHAMMLSLLPDAMGVVMFSEQVLKHYPLLCALISIKSPRVLFSLSHLEP